MIRLLAALALAVPTWAAAKDPLLNIPLDCTLGVDCYINDYFDHDPDEGVRDFRCGTMTRDHHRGIDFALHSNQAMRNGVVVIASAPGRVQGVRNEMPDISVTDPDAPDVTGRECGNGVVVNHGGGWVTRYCHLKKDSIVVQNGDRVRLGQPLGQVGMSGQTNYPHVHFSVYKRQARVDPFHPAPVTSCETEPGRGLWQTKIPYVDGGLLNAGFTNNPPSLAEIRDGAPNLNTMSSLAPVLVAWTQVYSMYPGDRFESKVTGPDGKLFVEQNTTLDLERNFHRLFLGKKRRNTPWPLGTYTANFKMIRAGTVIDEITIQTQVISP